MKIPKNGSKWAGSGQDTFHVLSTIELEGKTWVHYIKDNTQADPREYSCYLESFLERFRELPE
jgi:hypothetical protein